MLRYFLVLISLVSGQSAYNQTVHATVTDFENDKGVCRACIYNNSTCFDKSNGPVACSQFLIRGNVSNVFFNNLPPGTYAISVFHDENNNARFDRNFIGIPKEGYGASKNKLPFASAPRFSDNSFEFRQLNLDLTIKLRYL